MLLPPQYHEGRNIELIETLWNVNDDTDNKKDDCATGINRNIVECKYDLMVLDCMIACMN